MKKYVVREKVFEDMIDNLLFFRDIRGEEMKADFLDPDYEKHLHDPFLLKDAEKAAKRIVSAIKSNQKIVIFSDYDADGIPAAVIFYDFLNKIGCKNFSVYIPHRHNEGFGLSVSAVEKFKKENVNLIVTLDCGISDFEAVEVANSHEIDVIITDHHEPPEKVPNAFAIVNHKQKECNYPEKILCGSGVAFKLIQAIIKVENFNLKVGYEKWLLDMVGLATLSDMVPLKGENRVLAKFGMKVLRKSPRKGLVKLLSSLKISQANLSEDDLGFMVVPRINAASRMGVPMDAFMLLTTQDSNEAEVYVRNLDEINTKRKSKVADIYKEISLKIKDSDELSESDIIVTGDPEWEPSLLGLVANKCVEEFSKPTFIWGSDGNGVLKGSCRSDGVVSVVDIMRSVKGEVLKQFGGHAASGGFVISADSENILLKEINKGYKKIKKDVIEEKILFVDNEITVDEIGWNLYEQLEKLSPFGKENHRPLFIIKKIKISKVKLFGKEKNHLEISFKKNNGSYINAIAFFTSCDDFDKNIVEGSIIDLIATIELSLFAGRRELRLRIVDII